MKRKKPVNVPLMVMLILVYAIAVVSTNADPQLPKLFPDPPSYTATLLGDIFTIDINVSNVQDLGGYEFRFGYNTTLLDVVDAVVGPFPLQPPIWSLIEIHEPEGYVSVHVICDPTAGNGTLATITFNTTHAETASCKLDLYETYLLDSAGDPITHVVEDGNYNFEFRAFTVATDKLNYLPEENVTIYGNLTLGASPYEGFVGLEVSNPIRRTVYRTVQIGTPPPEDIIIVDVFSSDQWGTPQESFVLDTIGNFKVIVHNNAAVSKKVTVTINTYDEDNIPFGIGSTRFNLSGNTTSYIVFSVWIQPWVSLGNGTVYANAFTDFPSRGGIPYCAEKLDTFTITNGTLGASTLEIPDQDNNPNILGLTENRGNYNLTFKLPPNTDAGVYRVYASTFHSGTSLTKKTVFGVNVIWVPDSYSTIQEAVDAATPTNNSILVRPGTYNEHVTINKSLTLIGVDSGNTIINGSGTGTVVSVTADRVEVSRFTVQNGGSSTDSGIALNNSYSSTINENIIISNNGYGINILSSNNTNIFDNALSSNYYGIYLNHSTNAILRNNVMTCNKYNFGIFGESLSDFTHDIDTTNTVDGKPIYYWINQQNETVPSNAGYIAIVNSANIAVRGLKLTKNGQGVLLAFTADSLIERVNTTNNEYGIYMFQSYRDRIVGSEVSNNTVGIYQRYCYEDIICRNNFINNTNQVALNQSSNTWNDRASKGNYWSDYDGDDLNEDGVGDTLLPHQNVDWYPLMNPWIPTHDLIVTNVTFVLPCNETHLFLGWVINITATIQNEGDFTETLNVTAYFGENTIETKTIPELTPLDEIGINFTWKTTGVVTCCNYTISGYAHPLPSEINLVDNLFVDGQVYVRIMGDVN
ncbi:MAG: right-handed parallel beta-helix repeat-containing protein, partial [Candidatus Bathyarchaeota archaeon]|nr:right-handed parallel beta-helix repeat-containing protein [Candidatus Bathyarchaeota archaeon]